MYSAIVLGICASVRGGYKADESPRLHSLMLVARLTAPCGFVWAMRMLPKLIKILIVWTAVGYAILIATYARKTINATASFQKT